MTPRPAYCCVEVLIFLPPSSQRLLWSRYGMKLLLWAREEKLSWWALSLPKSDISSQTRWTGSAYRTREPSWLLWQRGPLQVPSSLIGRACLQFTATSKGVIYMLCMHACMPVYVCLMFREDNETIKRENQSAPQWSRKVSGAGSSELSRCSLPVIIGCWVGLALTRMPAFDFAVSSAETCHHLCWL